MKAMKITCDIGGTHARFGLAEGGQVSRIRKYKAKAFESLEAALERYCAEESLDGVTALRIATAAYDTGDVWRFVNQNEWVIDAAALRARWGLEVIMNDFEAATWGLLGLRDQDQIRLKEGAVSACPKCLVGPGTGLGLGFLTQTQNGPYVQRTHGGHMMVTAHTDEQTLIASLVQRMVGRDVALVFEHLVSGQGLYNIYRALCQMGGHDVLAGTPQEILGYRDTAIVRDSLRLFHEFFGLFARMVVVTGHAYGGLYLMGGVLDILAEEDLFDLQSFERSFTLQGVDSVTQALAATPIMRVTDPYLALRGVLHA